MPSKKTKKSVSLQAYVTKTEKIKVGKRWRNMGYFSESDYIRDLVRVDLKKK